MRIGSSRSHVGLEVDVHVLQVSTKRGAADDNPEIRLQNLYYFIRLRQWMFIHEATNCVFCLAVDFAGPTVFDIWWLCQSCFDQSFHVQLLALLSDERRTYVEGLRYNGRCNAESQHAPSCVADEVGMFAMGASGRHSKDGEGIVAQR
jgi:hypothetical protein